MLLAQIVLNEPTVHLLIGSFIAFETWKFRKIMSIDRKLSLVIQRTNELSNTPQPIPDNDK